MNNHDSIIDNNDVTYTPVRYGTRSACSQVTVAIAQNFLLITLGMTFGMPTVILGVLDHRVASNQTKLEPKVLV